MGVFRMIAELFMNSAIYQYAIGSLFALGIISKCIVNGFYINKLEQAKDMTHTSDKLLKKMKVIYENNMEIKGSIRNTKAFVEKTFMGVRVAGLNLSFWQHLSDVCKLAAIMISVISAATSYLTKGMTDKVIVYVFFGTYCVILLELFERAIDIKEKKRKVEVLMVDYLENVMRGKTQSIKVTREVSGNRLCYGQVPLTKEEKAKCTKKTKNEEEILSDIVNDYL